jgi:glycosyltransferase involved in cell wall biosynthesis
VAEAMHPKWGGVAEGVYQQSIELMRRGHHVEALSCEEDEVPRLSDAGITHHRFEPESRSWRKSAHTEAWVVAHVKNFDAVILNGLWMHPIWAAGKAARDAGVPYWVMTHGMLDPWFLRGIKKKLVKRAYWALYEGKTFRGSRGVLFTTQAEQELAGANYPLAGLSQHVVGYGIEDPAPSKALDDGDPQRLLFMSRIHPKKGLEMLFEAMRTSPGVSVQIAGTGEPDYEADLKQNASDLGDRVAWLGFTSGEAKDRALRECGAMILPSHQENFGVIVVEALAYGRPVLTTDKVNIWREIEADGAGLVGPDTPEGVKQVLSQWTSLPAEKRELMGRAARCSFESRFTISAHVDRLLEVVGQ